MKRAILVLVFLAATLVLASAGVSLAAALDDGVALYGQGKYAEAVDVLKKELADHPTNTKAYMFLATSYEKLLQWREAAEAWDKFGKLTTSAEERATGESMARKCRDRAAGKDPDAVSKTTEPTEPPSEFSKFERSEPAFFTVKTPHFTVMAKSRPLVDYAAKEAERHLKRIMAVFLPGREWTQALPLRIFKDHREYVIEAGMPQWSGGGFWVRPDGAGGVLRGVDLFACDEKGKFIPDLISKTLPHELTHVVIHELFGERAFGSLPRAINEGLAMYSEEGTDVLYERQLADAIKRGVYYKLDELFRMSNYPSNIGLFYAQSASATRYLIEHMKAEQFQTFLDELKKGQSVSSALQTAMMVSGDPIAAVEKNWLAMMKEKADYYAKNPETKKTDTKTPKPPPKTETKTEPPPKTDETKPEPYDPLKNEKKPPPSDDDEKDVVIEVKD